MRVCIHRGSREIGGSCVELESGGRRILLDLGMPLNADEDPRDYLPDVPGLTYPDDSLLGVLVSHPHIDHCGLLSCLDTAVPVGMGAAARRILAAAAPFMPGPWPVPAAGWDFTAGRSFRIGPFEVTPLLVDHSAYDSYALLIQADGTRVLYSGDLRAHGRKSRLFDMLVRNPPQDIDVLLMEGTTLGRDTQSAAYRGSCSSEIEAEQRLQAIMSESPGMVLVQTSSQNIDRVVSVYKAARCSGRVLLIDLYTAAILEATGNPRLPQSDWDGIRLFVPQRQRVQIVRQGLFDLLKRHSRNRIFPEQLGEVAEQAVLLFRQQHIQDLNKADCLNGAHYIYAQWHGYWEREGFDDVRAWLPRQQIPRHSVHCSGHAAPEDLRTLAEAIQPRVLVPMHSERPEMWHSLYDRVDQHADGSWWDAKPHSPSPQTPSTDPAGLP